MMTKVLKKRGFNPSAVGTRKTRKKTLQGQMMALVLAMVAVIIAVLSTCAIHFVTVSAEDALQKSMQVTTKALVSSVARRVDRFQEIAQTISVAYSDKQTQNPVFLNDLRLWKESHLLDGYDLLDASGRSLISGKDVSGNEAFQKGKAEPFLSNALVDGSSVHYDYALTNGGVTVLLHIPYEAVAKLISDIRVGTGDCYIMDTEGYKVAHPKIENVISREGDNNILKYKKNPTKASESVAKMESTMASGKSGFMFYTWAGIQKFASFEPVQNTNGWSISVTAPKKDFTQQVETSVVAIVLFGLLCILAAILGIRFIVRRITKPLREIEAATVKLASGDLGAEIVHTSNDELGSLADSARSLILTLRGYISNISEVLSKLADGDMTVSVQMNYQGDFVPIKLSMEHIITSLNIAMSDIRNASEQVSSNASQMSTAAQELSGGATEQAASLEEAAATMQEISEHVQRNDENVQKTKEMMLQTTQDIRSGDEHMQQLVGAMDAISDTSGQISTIVKAIDEIAFQTNILALNAAVEAARAGEVGKGFAVVADEVRGLAEKSAAAARDTTALIGSSIEAVRNGKLMTDEVLKSLETIKYTADQVSMLLGEIAEASQTQALSIQQTMTGIDQVSDVVQMNSAMAEQSAAVSSELSGQAQKLQQLLQRFRLKGAAADR